MPVATFDTLKFANTLKAAGVPSQQAEAQAVAFAEVIQVNMQDLVTKEDLERAVSDIRAELQTGLPDVRREFRADMDELRAEVRDIFQQMTARLDLMEQRLTARLDTTTAKFSGDIALLRWITGVAVFGIVTILIRMFVFRNA